MTSSLSLRDPSELEHQPPSAWGMPDKFSSWRPGQAHAVEDLIDAPTRFVGSNVPTGGGKSVIYSLANKLQGYRFTVLTSTKGLQSQLHEDFSSTGLVNIMGKSNYDCTDRTSLTCEEAGASCRAKAFNQCPHKQAYDAACRAPAITTNYACWLHRNRASAGGVSAFTQAEKHEEPLPIDCLVLDEGHDAVEELSSFIAISLSNEDIGSPKFINLSVPDSDTTMPEWVEFAKSCFKEVGEKVAATESQLRAQVRLSDQALKDHSRLKRIHAKLRTLATCQPDMWVVEPSQHGFQFDPVWPGAYASHLFRDIPKIIITSATIRRKTMYLLGLDDSDFTFYEYPSTFSVNDAPIIHIPTARLSFKSTPEEVAAVYRRIDQIVAGRQDRKGIVHTVSFKRAQEIIQASEFRRSMLANTKSWSGQGMPTAQIVEKFKAGKPPLTLVSPSVSTGYDFPGLACEYNIVAKVPFPDSRSEVMKERLKRDPEYGHYVAAQDIVQACGRGNRFPGDRCQNFIVDDSIKWFTWKFKHLFPAYFHKFYRVSETIPAPLKKM